MGKLEEFRERFLKDPKFRECVKSDKRFRRVAEALENYGEVIKSIPDLERYGGIPHATADRLLGKALAECPGAEGDPEARDEKSVKRGSALPSQTTQSTLRKLDEMYADALSALAQKVGWWTNAMLEIGQAATMIALQTGKVDPGRVREKLEEFKDASAFVSFVMDKFTAMVQAASDSATAVAECQDQLRLKESGIKYLGYVLKRAKEKIEALLFENLMLRKDLEFAVSRLDPEDVNRMFMAKAFTAYAYSPQQGGGVNNSEGEDKEGGK